MPGLVSAGLLIVIMVVFMFYSRNSKIVVEMEKEVEKGKADSLVAVDNLSKKCASRIKSQICVPRKESRPFTANGRLRVRGKEKVSSHLVRGRHQP